MKPVSKAFPAVLLIADRAQARSPLINILGSYFPGWMLCVLAAIILTVFLRFVIQRAGFADHVEPAVLTYPALTLFFSFGFWLMFFA